MINRTHSTNCDREEVYTDFDHYGMTWTCYCGALAMNTIVGANFQHRDTKKKEPPKREVTP